MFALFSFVGASAISFETCNIDCAGNGIIETEVDNLNSRYFVGLRYVQDSVGNHQYYLKFKIENEKHVISPNRVALIKFENKTNLPIMELFALLQVSENMKVKSFRYKFLKNYGGLVTNPLYAASGVFMMDDEDKYNIAPTSYTYYPLSDDQLQMIIENKIEVIRVDTSDSLIDITSGADKLGSILSDAYEEIQRVLSKDVYKDFNELTLKNDENYYRRKTGNNSN